MPNDCNMLKRFEQDIEGNVSSKRLSGKGTLVVLVFHSIFKDKTELSTGLIDPSLSISQDGFHLIIETLMDNKVKFLSSTDLLNRLDKNTRYALITFDDGYYNNVFALPTLKKYGVSALFFISTNYINTGECFWWDVLYRERKKQGAPTNTIYSEMQKLKANKDHIEIKEYIEQNFGSDSVRPKGNIDRPFSWSELEKFSKDDLVQIGNHTRDHVALANYSSQAIHSQICDAQKDFLNNLGWTPLSISYPYGKISVSRDVVKITKELGFRFIFTGSGKNTIPLKCYKQNFIWLKRSTIDPLAGITQQYTKITSNISKNNLLANMANWRSYWSFIR